MADVRIQTWQAYAGVGGNIPKSEDSSKPEDGSLRAGFKAGVTLEFADQFESWATQRLGLPVNFSVERVAPGVGSYGGEVSSRLNLGIVNLDLGTKLSAFSGGGETGLGVTPFGRVGIGYTPSIRGAYNIMDIANLEVGGIAHSGHSEVLAGGAYVMLNLNLPAFYVMSVL